MPLIRSLLLAGAVLLSGAEIAAAQTAGPAVDESALRYFAQQGDQPRLAAEIARLQALHPGWTPPDDPLALPPPGDPRTDALWSLLGAGKTAEARAGIAAREAEQPGWQAPADLLARLRLVENRARLVNASDLKQAATVIAVAAESPELLTCDDMDVLWRLAEAFAVTGKADRSADVYRYVLDTCPAPEARLASMQKASLLLDRPRLEHLLSREQPDASGAPEFAALRANLARKAVADAGAEGAPAAAAEDVELLEAAFAAAPTASDALLLGWSSYRQGQKRDAERWFGRAAELDDSAEAALGVALVQIDAAAYAAAEATIHPWREASDQAEAVYLAAAANLLAGDPPRPIDEAALARIVPAVMDARDAAVAQQLGWYARAFGQTQVAADWFATALEWDPASEPAAFGLALARKDLGDSGAVEAVRTAWAGRSPRIAELGAAPAPAPAAATRTTRPRSTPQAAAAAEPSRPRVGGGCGAGNSADAALARGWCLMEVNRPLEAARAFAAAAGSGSAKVRSDAAYGESLAYLREGLVDQAAVAAVKAPQTRERSVELQAAILADRAMAAFRQRRYADSLVALDQRARLAGERVDLMVLRGYAYLKLRRKREARQVFAAAAQTGDPKAREGLLIVDAQIRGGR